MIAATVTYMEGRDSGPTTYREGQVIVAPPLTERTSDSGHATYRERQVIAAPVTYMEGQVIVAPPPAGKDM